jgi:DNA-binding transcriptional LysR family regulator
MHRIDLKKLDLNLLVVFDMLMHERSVSRAADRLGLTQPAISHALARLRAQIGDPLLVRMGGRMEPTPFAINLDESMRPHLAGLARAFESKETFDPATSRRVFRIVLPDFAIHCAHSDTSDQVFRRHMISHSGVSDHPEMTPSGAVW